MTGKATSTDDKMKEEKEKRLEKWKIANAQKEQNVDAQAASDREKPGPSTATVAPVLIAVKHVHPHFPYNFLPTSEKICGCLSQRAGCVVIGVGQIILGTIAVILQAFLALMAHGGIDLTKYFGTFPKEDQIKRFIFGVSLVDAIAKVVFVFSGILLIIGAAKMNASLLNTWTCINSYTLASSLATNAAAAGGLLSFTDSREEYALPLTFDTVLMGVQYYTMTIVKGYHNHLEKAHEVIKETTWGGTQAGMPFHDHDVVVSSVKFRCCKCCAYEEEMQKHKNVDNVKVWEEAEKERRLSLLQQAHEAEQRKLQKRAEQAETNIKLLLVAQALKDQADAVKKKEQGKPGTMKPGQTTAPQGNPNVGPGQYPPPWIQDTSRRPGQLPSEQQPMYGPHSRRPTPGQGQQTPTPQQSQPKPFPKRPTNPNVQPIQGQVIDGQQQPVPGPSQRWHWPFGVKPADPNAQQDQGQLIEGHQQQPGQPQPRPMHRKKPTNPNIPIQGQVMVGQQPQGQNQPRPNARISTDKPAQRSQQPEPTVYNPPTSKSTKDGPKPASK